MSWKGVTVMDQGIRFITEDMAGYFPFDELCIQVSISRKTGYKWIQHYENHGAEGLTNRSRKPYFCPMKQTPLILGVMQVLKTDPNMIQFTTEG